MENRKDLGDLGFFDKDGKPNPGTIKPSTKRRKTIKTKGDKSAKFEVDYDNEFLLDMLLNLGYEELVGQLDLQSKIVLDLLVGKYDDHKHSLVEIADAFKTTPQEIREVYINILVIYQDYIKQKYANYKKLSLD